MANSTNKKGNYYKRKTRDWFKKLGYTVELLEINYPLFIRGKIIFIKKDILQSDGVSYNKDEFILWNSKLGSTYDSRKTGKKDGRKDYRNLILPSYIKKQLFIWQPRKKDPEIIEVK